MPYVKLYLPAAVHERLQELPPEVSLSAIFRQAVTAELEAWPPGKRVEGEQQLPVA